MSMSRAGIVNFGLRALTQLGRLAITLVVARVLGIADLGLYRVFSIYGDYARQLNGLSFHTYIVRELHTHDRENWPSVFAWTAKFHLRFSVVALALWLVLFFSGILPWWTSIAFFLTVAIDIFNTTIENYLVAAGHAIAAGVSLFIRQALWVYVLVAWVLLAKHALDFRTILVAWVGGCGLAISVGLALLFRYRLASTKNLSTAPAGWERRGIKTGSLFTFVGLLLYVVTTSPTLLLGIIRGEAEVGILSFFFTAFSTVGTLVYASVIAIATPALLSTQASGDTEARERIYANAVKRSVLVTIVLTCLAALALPFLIQLVNQPELNSHHLVATLCAVGGIIFSLVQLPYLRLYILGEDAALLKIIGFSAAVSVVLSIVTCLLFGLLGAAISLIANHLIAGVLLWSKSRSIPPDFRGHFREVQTQ